MRMPLIKIIVVVAFLLIGGHLVMADDDIQMQDRMIEYSHEEAKEATEVIDTIESFGYKQFDDLNVHIPNIEAPLPPKDAKTEPLVYTRDQRWWWTLLKEKKLSMSDTTVVWPKFLKFILNVYNWADNTFYSYDPEYVVGTGKRW